MNVNSSFLSCRVFVCLLAFVVLSATRTSLAGDSSGEGAATSPATRPTTNRNQDRLLAIRAVTLAAIEYARAHDQKIPTTEQLAESMQIAPAKLRYRVVPRGLLKDHMKRVKGDWPEVLIAETPGGDEGKWAFGFVDGMCMIDTPESYKKMKNSGALQAIAKASTRPASE